MNPRLHKLLIATNDLDPIEDKPTIKQLIYEFEQEEKYLLELAMGITTSLTSTTQSDLYLLLQ